MDQNDKDKYLPEDQDILKELESVEYDTSGMVLEKRKAIISKLQIKAMLRGRKQAADTDSSNKKFTIMLGAFALVQILIAGFQFALEAADSKNVPFAVFSAITFLIVMFWFTRNIFRLLKDR